MQNKVSNTPNITTASPVTRHWLKIGHVGRVYGIKGWVKIYAYTEPYTNIIHYKPWHLFLNQEWREIKFTDCKPHGNTLIAHFAGIDTPEQAKAYVNIPIAVTRDQLPILPADEYYWTDLYGLAVYNLKQEYLGEIIQLFETGANDVLIIAKDGKELLIPYVRPHVILSIDLPKKAMIVDWENEI